MGASDPVTPTAAARTTADDQAGRGQARAAGVSNDLGLMQRVLQTAGARGYFRAVRVSIGASAGSGGAVGRDTGDVDAVTGHPVTHLVGEAEAAMVEQLLARGWLRQRRAHEDRTSVQPDQPTGRRRIRLRGHSVVVTAASTATLQRRRALAAVPYQSSGENR